MQIAGNKCKVCERGIILSTDGKFCERCGTLVHLACALADNCDVCGQRWQRYEPPKPDPMRDAILPLSLRPSKSGGALVAAGLILLLAFLFFIVWFGLL
jgi:hypothetical protein